MFGTSLKVHEVQTSQTQIRGLLRESSDLRLRCLFMSFSSDCSHKWANAYQIGRSRDQALYCRYPCLRLSGFSGTSFQKWTPLKLISQLVSDLFNTQATHVPGNVGVVPLVITPLCYVHVLLGILTDCRMCVLQGKLCLKFEISVLQKLN